MKKLNENNESIRERLLLFLEYISESTNDFYSKTGLSNAFLRMKNSSITSDNLLIISNIYPELNLEWLIKGIGYMLKPCFSLSRIKIKTKNNKKYAEMPLEQIVGVYEKLATYMYLTMRDKQKTIQEQNNTIKHLETVINEMKNEA